MSKPQQPHRPRQPAPEEEGISHALSPSAAAPDKEQTLQQSVEELMITLDENNRLLRRVLARPYLLGGRGAAASTPTAGPRVSQAPTATSKKRRVEPPRVETSSPADQGRPISSEEETERLWAGR